MRKSFLGLVLCKINFSTFFLRQSSNPGAFHARKLSENLLYRVLVLAVVMLGFSSLRAIEGPSALNSELSLVFQIPNKHEWVCTLNPALFHEGLTPWLETHVEVKRVAITHEELEKLYCEVYCDLLAKMNGHKVIRPYLASFPLTPDTFFVMLMVHTQNGANAQKFTSRASIRQGMLELDIETVFGREVRRRPLSELKLIKEEYSPKVPRTMRSFYVRLPFLTRPYLRGERREAEIFDVIKTLCRKHALKVLTLGSVEAEKLKKKPIQVAFFSNERLTLDKTRKMTEDCMVELAKAAKKDLPRLSMYDKKKAEDEGVDPFCKEVSFRISFWDEKLERPKAPVIAEVRCFEGVCEYYTADDNQKLVLVFNQTL